MEKKGIIAIVVIAVIVVATITGVSMIFLMAPLPPAIIMGSSAGPRDIDPYHCWDSAGINIIDQVVERLFTYNLSHPDLELIPQLAADFGTWSTDGKEYTVNLRTTTHDGNPILFHDGAPFNAEAVKKSFDRLAYFLDHTAETPDDLSQLIELYELSHVQIIKEVAVIDADTVKFTLSFPYAPFEPLLCFSGSGILSPNTPAKEVVATATGKIIGTGPFIYEYYTANVEVVFHANPTYWRKVVGIPRLVISIIEDTNARNLAMSAGDITLLEDPLPELLDWFEGGNNPNCTLIRGPQTTVIRYMGMNNNPVSGIPKAIRKAISYAVNYSYIHDEINAGETVQMVSPIPKGILYHKSDVKTPYMDLSLARQFMQDAGYGTTLSLTNDAAWEAGNFVTYNYTYNSGNLIRERMGTLMTDNLKSIGIKVVPKGLQWSDFLDRLYNVSDGFNQLQLYFIGWGPDYNDPCNFINPLFSNTSESNSAQVNDLSLQTWMEEAIVETDPAKRKILYDKIQVHLFGLDDPTAGGALYPWILGYIGKSNNVVHWNNIHGYYSNAMENVYFGDCYFEW